MNDTLSLPRQIIEWPMAVFLIIIIIMAAIVVIVGGIKLIKHIINPKKELDELEEERLALELELEIKKRRKEINDAS